MSTENLKDFSRYLNKLHVIHSDLYNPKVKLEELIKLLEVSNEVTGSEQERQNRKFSFEIDHMVPNMVHCDFERVQNLLFGLINLMQKEQPSIGNIVIKCFPQPDIPQGLI